jgi:hypothetical protein
MAIQTMVNCALILCGALIMLFSIVKARELIKAIPFVTERRRRDLVRGLMLHRGLMIFFVFGYCFVLVAVALRYSMISESILSIILFFGAVFVFIGIFVQSRLLSEVQNTLQGILPICARCKKIRVEDGIYNDPAAWKVIETYISEKADVEFSHGLCPGCYEDALKNL